MKGFKTQYLLKVYILFKPWPQYHSLIFGEVKYWNIWLLNLEISIHLKKCNQNLLSATLNNVLHRALFRPSGANVTNVAENKINLCFVIWRTKPKSRSDLKKFTSSILRYVCVLNILGIKRFTGEIPPSVGVMLFYIHLFVLLKNWQIFVSIMVANRKIKSRGVQCLTFQYLVKKKLKMFF